MKNCQQIPENVFMYFFSKKMKNKTFDEITNLYDVFWDTFNKPNLPSRILPGFL